MKTNKKYMIHKVLLIFCFISIPVTAQTVFKKISELNDNITLLTKDSIGNIWAGTESMGIYISSNSGYNWEKVNIGFINSACVEILFGAHNKKFIATKRNGVFSYDSTTGWKQNRIENRIISSMDINSKQQLFIGTYPFLFRSDDYGENWVQIRQEFNFNTAKIFCGSNDNIFIGGNLGMAISRDNGASWETVNLFSQISPLVFCEFPQNTLYVGADNLYKTTDNGNTWLQIFSYPLHRDTRFNDMIVSSKGEFIVSFSRSTYGGLFTSNYQNDMFWTDAGSGLIYPSIPTSLTFDKNESVLASVENYIYHQVKKDTVILENYYKYRLAQNYPNPFNPATTIEYSIPSDQFVEINLYNSIGEKVAALLNEYRSAGNYKITFNAGKLPSGIYIYQIIAGSYQNSRKMIVLR